MPTDPLEIFATELSLRLEQFGFKKKPLDIERNGPEKHCVIARLKVAGASANVFAFTGPYLRGRPTLWAGFGSRSIEAIDRLEDDSQDIQFSQLAYDDWMDYVLAPTKVVSLARSQNFVREDYRKETKWAWLGRYLSPTKEAAKIAAAFIVASAKPFLLIDDGRRSGVGGPTETKAEAKRRLVQTAFRNEVARRAEGCCAVTGCTTPAALRASHILSWQKYPKLRADPDNGLYLVGTLDALFDRGRISFDGKNRIMISDVIPSDEWMRLGLSKDLHLRMRPTRRQHQFLKIHRELKFLRF